MVFSSCAPQRFRRRRRVHCISGTRLGLCQTDVQRISCSLPDQYGNLYHTDLYSLLCGRKDNYRLLVIDIDGVDRYVLEEDVTRNREEIEEMKETEAERIEAREEAFAEIERRKEEERAAYWKSLAEQTRNPNWSGPVLSKSRGSITGPTGRETYYNLNMDVIVRIMRRMGFSEEEYPYWVRNDGCKMLGPYIMCAANFNMFPRGTTVECSLGTCLVCDTGGFAAGNPTQLDIAVTW